MKTKIKELKEYGKIFKILYVEDNEEARLQTEKMLSNFFVDITLAVDGQDGLNKYVDYYKKHNVFYDLVLSDINMPIMDGSTMIREMLKHNFLQAVIITTAHNELECLLNAIDLGVSGFLVKPITNAQFINTLFKVSLVVNDRKLLEAYVEQMEELTISLEEQYKEVKRQNLDLEQSSRVINTMVNKTHMSHLKTTPKEEDMSQNEFVKEQIRDLITEDLHELIELHTEIDTAIIEIINNLDSIDDNLRNFLVLRFTNYATILNRYSFFAELSKEIHLFTMTLDKEPLPSDKETVENIFMLLETFVFVLGKWQNDLKSGDENKINTLDASMTSDMKTITNMWSQKEANIQDIFNF